MVLTTGLELVPRNIQIAIASETRQTTQIRPPKIAGRNPSETTFRLPLRDFTLFDLAFFAETLDPTAGLAEGIEVVGIVSPKLISEANGRSKGKPNGSASLCSTFSQSIGVLHAGQKAVLPFREAGIFNPLLHWTHRYRSFMESIPPKEREESKSLSIELLVETLASIEQQGEAIRIARNDKLESEFQVLGLIDIDSVNPNFTTYSDAKILNQLNQ